MKPSYVNFNNEKYKQQLKTYTTKSEVGVLSYNYSKKIHPYWKFKTPQLALQSAQKIYNIFLHNLHNITRSNTIKSFVDSFIKADICRKFLQMGYTRSMRYYYHKNGVKWVSTSRLKLDIS